MSRSQTRILVIALIAALVGLACASEPEPMPEPEPVVVEVEEEEVVVEVAEPTPPPPPPAKPVELPKTASPLPLVGLAGLSALGLAGALRLARGLRRE